MRIERSTSNHLKELRTWFSDQHAMHDWGGPGMSYPASQATFNAQLKQAGPAHPISYSLTLEQPLIGFGQFYSRLQHCHLRRLVIAPSYRGQGLIDVLIKHLAKIGCSSLGHDRLSLFVLNHNQPAIKAYLRLGFTPQKTSTHVSLQHCIYMTKPAFD